MIESKVNIRRLKDFASKHLPKNWVLRELVLTEHDELEPSEFCTKMDVWLKLARGETHERNIGGSQ